MRASTSTSARNNTTSSMVDWPDVLKRQNNSDPANTAADTHATESSNNRLPSRKTIHTATKNSPWFTIAIHKSGTYTENCCPGLASGRTSGQPSGLTLSAPASTTG